MIQTLRLDTFKELLQACPDESATFINPLSRFEGYTDGVQYLFDLLAVPLLQGKSLYDITADYTAFEQEDIHTLYNYLDTHYIEDYRINNLAKLGRAFETAVPESHTVTFV